MHDTTFAPEMSLLNNNTAIHTSSPEQVETTQTTHTIATTQSMVHTVGKLRETRFVLHSGANGCAKLIQSWDREH